MKRRAIVTGVAGGVGAAVAQSLVDEGWEVAGVDLEGPPEIELHGFERTDLADAVAVDAAIRRLAGDGLDALVNNAAEQPVGPLIDTAPDSWDRTFAVNVRAAYLAIRASHQALVARSGSVVNVASVHAVATSAGRSVYAASKGALTALTRAAALELAGDGVRVNAVLPGATDTAMLRAGVAAASIDVHAVAERTPLQRIAEPMEIAQAVLFLVDAERSGFVTGTGLVVDGGVLARLATE